ncbi:tetraspanin [Plakobranchus ocellatus]|uniref:Tetraspanin n=1 Tax=Plakobranchus ocellatus TaxID=259542 RepID=A0AAV4DBT2_9GAST|nr:tetraspanin [Plakobranchus ocellatus]
MANYLRVPYAKTNQDHTSDSLMLKAYFIMVLISFLKLLLNIFNVVFIAVGITLVGIGIWTAVVKVYVSLVIGDSLFRAAAYLIICVGFITIGVCVVGLVAVIREKQRWLWVYLGLSIFCFCALMTSAILAIVFKSEVEGVMVDNMRKSLIDKYGKDGEVTDAWDQLQSDLGCCAVNETYVGHFALFDLPYADNSMPESQEEKARQDSWPIYKRTEFFRMQLSISESERKYVPESCCKYDSKIGDYAGLSSCQFFSTGPPNNFKMKLNNDYLHYDGCYSKARRLMLDQSDILVAMGFVFGFIMIAGMALTFLILRALRAEEEEKMQERRRPENYEASNELL